ncbi:MAG: glycosyltransferase [Tannerellaceae bacterium]|jgi:glycosyltransferase involved in cell wall biosynthesis|nr:glycosyltransferase [Tannerellaceae bacterium]
MIRFDYPFTVREIVLLSVAGAFFLVQLYYYLIIYMRPARYAKHAPKALNDYAQQPSISVIVYARNENGNLEKNLPILLNQNYGQYEVIVINDGFTDESDTVLLRFEKEYPNLYHTFIPEESKYLSRRKLSLTLGIKAAKYDTLFFIEASCRPMSADWLATMAGNYDEDTMILLGFCAYTTNKGLLHKLISYDNLLSGVQYISSALSGHPYSGNGGNLSYRKQLFFANKGFSHSLSLHAGDDDLFVNQTATRTNTRVGYSPAGITEMEPAECYAAWKDIKIARASTQSHYRGWQLAFYRTETISAVMFLLSIAAMIADGLLYNPFMIAAAALMYIALYATKVNVTNKLSLLLRQKKTSGWLPFLEIIRIIINVYIRIYRAFKGKRDYTFTFGNK